MKAVDSLIKVMSKDYEQIQNRLDNEKLNEEEIRALCLIKQNIINLFNEPYVADYVASGEASDEAVFKHTYITVVATI